MTEPARAKPTLLIVDDEPLNRDLLRRMLVWDYEIAEAPDGQAALELLAGQPFQLVLCDHAMPNVSGVELLRRLRTDLPASVGVLLTGYDELPEVQSACAEGAIFAVIGKPFEHTRLLDVLARAAEEAARRRAASP